MFAKFMLLLVLPGILLSSAPHSQFQQPSQTHIISFDEIMSLIDLFDDPYLASTLTDAQLDKIAQLMTHLAQKGNLTNDPGLQNLITYDTHLLLDNTSQFALAYTHDLIDDAYETLPCGRASDKWKQTRRFVRKHKTVIIIGAAVLVTATIAIVAISASAGAVAGAAAGASTCLKSDSSHTNHSAKPASQATHPLDSHSPTTSISDHQPLDLQQIETDIKHHLAQSLPIDLADPSNATKSFSIEKLKDNMRYYSSHFAHKVVDDVSVYLAFMPQLTDMAHDSINMNLLHVQDTNAVSDQGKATTLYDKVIDGCHNKIDQVFGTTIAKRFTKEAKHAQQELRETLGMPKMQEGYIPWPGTLKPMMSNACRKPLIIIKPSDLQSAQTLSSLKKLLSSNQIKSLKKFNKKFPNTYDTKIYKLPNGSRAFQKKIQAKNISGSYAIYEKQINASGATIQFTKTTVSSDGAIVHVKQKAPNPVIINGSK